MLISETINFLTFAGEGSVMTKKVRELLDMARMKIKANYPIAETFNDHLFSDTIRIQKLIWSICLGMMVARLLRFGAIIEKIQILWYLVG